MQHRAFTVRSDERGVTVSFDDGSEASYDVGLSAEILALLDGSDATLAEFSAATSASFAEAERASPDPTTHGRMVELAAVQDSYGDGELVPLGGLVHDQTGLFAEVLARRRSRRDFDAVSLADIATLLVRSARVLSWSYDDRGIELSLRPHPSAGAMHPLSIELIATQVTGLEPGCWAFDALRCVLVRSRREPATLARCLEQLASAVDARIIPAAIVIVANPARTLSRYPHGTAHVWRDAGALLTTMHLAATDLALYSTIVGTSGILDRFDPPVSVTVDVGALAVGGAVPVLRETAARVMVNAGWRS